MHTMYYDDMIAEIDTMDFKDGVYTLIIDVSEYIPYEPPYRVGTITLITSNIVDWNNKDWKVKRFYEQGIILK